MPDYILLMHSDAAGDAAGAWEDYIARLGPAFLGGSSIGDGESVRAGAPPASVTRQLTGFIRVRAADLVAARALVIGNPVYEAGGTVEVRLLPED